MCWNICKLMKISCQDLSAEQQYQRFQAHTDSANVSMLHQASKVSKKDHLKRTCV